ncbi:hypothetical protein [Novipirellula aureliae]|uniref:hypothetical protein n=1 Tax=Novipirellula aureliae TaxID=2527966 RepID=UPI0011B705A0|nr:hypothetical protein [Novipirellula aureliae]
MDFRLELNWSPNADDSACPPQPFRIEVEVVDPNSNRVNGSTSPATISELENRCDDVSTCNAFSITPPQAASLQQTGWSFESPLVFGNRRARVNRTATSKGGARFRVQASAEAELVVRVKKVAASGPLASVSSDDGDVTRIAIADLAAQPIDNHGVIHWTLKRIDGDMLRISMADERLVREPNTPLEIVVRANSLVVPQRGLPNNEPLQLISSMIRLSDRETVWTQTSTFSLDSLGNSQPIQITDSTSSQPGVYELRYEVATESRLWSRLRRRGEIVTRIGRPVVVLPEKESVGGAIDFATWPTIQKIKFTEISDWAISNWPVSNWPVRQMFSSRGPAFFSASSASVKTRPSVESTQLIEEIYEGEKVARVPIGQSFETSLPKLRIGYPHHISLRYPANRTLKLRIQITSDLSGEEQSGGADYVVHDFPRASDRYDDENQKWRTQSFLYYANGNERIHITNLDRLGDALIESIEIKSGPAKLATAFEPPIDRSSDDMDASKQSFRMTALRLTSSDWIEAYGKIPRCHSLKSDFSVESIAIDKLVTATTRVCNYASLLGADTLLVDANEGGKTWFKTNQYAPTRCSHRHERDQLEILLSLADRLEKRVVVGLDTVMPIDANPNEKQRSLVALTKEVVKRSLSHRCFAGIWLSCGQNDQPKSLDQARLSEDEQRQDRDRQRAIYDAIAEQCQGKSLLLVDLPDSAFVNRSGPCLVDKSWPNHSRRSCIVPVATQFRGAYECISAEMEAEKRIARKVADLQGVAGQIGLSVRSDLDSGLIDRGFAEELNVWVDRLDPLVVLHDDTTMQMGLQDGLRKTMNRVAALTMQKMNEFASPDPVAQTVHLKWGVENQHLVLLVTNQSPWPSSVQLRCRKAIEWESIGDSSKTVDQVENGRVTEIRLDAGEMKLLRSATREEPQALGMWTSSVQGGAIRIEKIKTDVATIVEKLGTLSDSTPYQGLSNGSFEATGNVGIKGWLHAQYPAGSVIVDDSEATDGKRSLCMKTDGAGSQQTWLVTETITPPKSGRLAVSMSLRAEATHIGSSHQVRVSIEGTQFGQSFRFSETVALPRNGQWQPRKIVTEAATLVPEEVETLRVTIDSLSPGKIWIDDVRLHDFFPTNQERTELQTQSFLAVQGIQRGNLEPSSKLLQNRWAQRLIEASSTDEAVTVETQNSPAHVDTPGVAERFRSWLPNPIRF